MRKLGWLGGGGFLAQAIDQTALGMGREAYQRHAWREALDFYREADKQDKLPADDLAALSESAWWVGDLEECINARERAYAAYIKEGNNRRAAVTALELSSDYSVGRLAHSIAQGWYSRAERLLEKEPESPEHGHLAWNRTQGFLAVGDLDAALEQAELVLDIGTRFGHRDLQAYGLLDKGRALVAKGRVSEGLPLLDEATVAAVSGELGPLASGIIYCLAITATTHLGDYGRAGQWTEAAKRWCERQSISGFPGVCRIHRAEIVRLRGAWAEAEQEARRALSELQSFSAEFTAEGFYEIGEIRLRMGDLSEAEDAFLQAHEVGRRPEPGLSMLRLARGNTKSAHASITRALGDESLDALHRSRLLPAQVEIAITADDLDSARSATEELESIGETFGTPPLKAAALRARGELQLAHGDAARAAQSLHRSWRLWKDADLPYEAARARMLLGVALRADGDEDGGTLELQAARSAFERLGAVLDLRTAMELLGEEIAEGVPRASAPGARIARTFMFTDIVTSTKIVEALGDQKWEGILRWHDQALRKCFAAHRGEEVNKVGDGFFVAFDSPSDAVECAVGIQRKLREHNRDHAYAPDVRIGLHEAEATRKHRDYEGGGVHTAARIGALAQGGEILASRAVIDATQIRFPVGERRLVELKGVSEPVEVATISSD
jgi:class 3 adenylate cyclase